MLERLTQQKLGINCEICDLYFIYVGKTICTKCEKIKNNNNTNLREREKGYNWEGDNYTQSNTEREVIPNSKQIKSNRTMRIAYLNPNGINLQNQEKMELLKSNCKNK